MAQNDSHKIIAVEEHFLHNALTAHFTPATLHQPKPLLDRLYDFVGIRIEEMDRAGIDMQVLSHQSPGSQRLAEDVAITACQSVNDALAKVIAETPNRFQGFAMIPTMLPQMAADELQRAVEELGLKGAMVHGMSRGEMIDGKAYWPIFARAEKLDVPIYLHPARPDNVVTARYYAPYDESHPMFTTAAWGFGVETGTQAIRLILSGVFEQHPDLRIILGHLGEALPFWMPRIAESLSRSRTTLTGFDASFRHNFWITTSGFFADEALLLCLKMLEPDRILFAVDWPYADNKLGVDWLRQAPIKNATRDAIFSGNARRILRL